MNALTRGIIERQNEAVKNGFKDDCRREVPDHTSCGFIMYIVLYSGAVGTVDFLNKLYSFYASVA